MSLNNNIKIDLHIHSIASKYKEDEKIVKNSTADNLDVLFNKLKKHKIELFSITDHNRFDSELYKKMKIKIKEEGYENLNFIPGIEFDVKLEEFPGSHKGQINAYFDISTSENFDHIQNIVEGKYLKSKDYEYFEAKEFEMLLKDLGFNVLLIASQLESIDKQPRNKSSLSFHTKNPRKYLKSGYINALEFQKPHVEGILKNDLKDLPENSVSLITFSDCHEWEAYPKHDSSKSDDVKYFTNIKALPTFRGLLMALTSPTTRLNRRTNSNLNYIKEIEIGGSKIPLDPSVNVIIGNNGSGKSTIFSVLSSKMKDENSHYKKIVKLNGIKISDSDKNKSFFSIKQNEIIDKHFNSKKLFNSITYNIDDEEFEMKMSSYSKAVLKSIEENIELNSNKNEILNSSVQIVSPINVYYPIFDKYFEQFDEKKYDNSVRILKKINNDISMLKKDGAFNEDNDSISKINEMESILSVLGSKYNSLKNTLHNKRKIVNKIESIFNDLEFKNSNNKTSAEKDYTEYLSSYKDLLRRIKSHTELQRTIRKKIPFPDKIVEGIDEKNENGFVFKSIPKYADGVKEEDFWNNVFNKGIDKLEDIKKIKTDGEFKKNLKKSISLKILNSEKIFDNNVESFIKLNKKRREIILKSDDSRNVGSTPGELAMAYINYLLTKNMMGFEIIMLDQPEDNISNLNIAKDIITKINATRDKKQYIIVTHNPLLVVNLDADNLVYLENKNDKIYFKSGCLEYRDSQTNIVNLIIEKMEGGLNAIKTRMEVYKNEHHHD